MAKPALSRLGVKSLLEKNADSLGLPHLGQEEKWKIPNFYFLVALKQSYFCLRSSDHGILTKAFLDS